MKAEHKYYFNTIQLFKTLAINIVIFEIVLKSAITCIQQELGYPRDASQRILCSN